MCGQRPQPPPCEEDHNKKDVNPGRVFAQSAGALPLIQEIAGCKKQRIIIKVVLICSAWRHGTTTGPLTSQTLESKSERMLELFFSFTGAGVVM